MVEISTLSAYLSEYEPPEKYNKQCLHPDCGFKFETTNELNAHMFTVHKSGFKAVWFLAYKDRYYLIISLLS